MRQLARFTLIQTLLAMLAGMPLPRPAFAQGYAPPAFEQGRYGLSQAELDQMLAPIALYPDALLSQLLIATTYWPELAEAARFSLDHPELDHEDALPMVEAWSWHPSVKSLLAFPQLLAMLGQRPAWAARLGDAFLVHQSRVMDTIQMLRQRAQAAGSLQSSPLINVVQQGQATLLLSPDPQLIYVPWYNANLVYGRWWWPSHPPLVWTAWSGGFGPRGYMPGAYPHVVALPTRLFVAAFDWHRRAARMVHAEPSSLLAHAPHVLPASPAHRTGEGRLALQGPHFTTATAARAGARPAPSAADGVAIDSRSHQPVPGAGQSRPTSPLARAAAAAITAPAAAIALNTPAATPTINITHDQFARQPARQPAVATTTVTQAAPAAPQAAQPGQAIGTRASGQVPLAAVQRGERPAGILRPEPLAQPPHAENAAHGSRTEHAAGIQRMESSGRPHSPGRTALHSAGVQQTQRPQTLVRVAVPGIAVATAPAVAPAATGRTPGNHGDSQQRARAPR